MHLLVRETHSLDEGSEATDLGLAPAPVLFFSFSDSDLGAAASAWQLARKRGEPLPLLRLASLQKLRHPMSVDILTDELVPQAKIVIVRLLGGIDYWRYGVEELHACCRQHGIKLALLAGDGRKDERLADFSTLPAADCAALEAAFNAGGAGNVELALRQAAFFASLGPAPPAEAQPLPAAGEHDFGVPAESGRPLAVITFYRSYLLAVDLAPLEALARALDAEGLDVRALYVSSLKEGFSARLVAEKLAGWRPAILLNATGFAARMDAGAGSPLDAAGCPVLQLALAGSHRDAWSRSSRGLGQSDLAMQVVLPELDGRLFEGVISFKAPELPDLELQFARPRHAPWVPGITAAARRAARWARLATLPRHQRRLAIVLSDYPGAAGQAAHAVGLDAPASLAAMLADLAAAGYDAGSNLPGSEELVAALCRAAPQPFLTLADYDTLFAALPAAAREAVTAAWGLPAEDPAVAGGAFTLRLARYGNLTAAIQPDRGSSLDRKASYHDADLPPRHGYVAFYLWLAHKAGIDAMVHLGTHGTLEWLPGKAVAQSEACFPALLTAGLPVIYPFIVNNPGEAAAAKRRLGAVTLGHLTPPLKSAGSHGPALELEKLIDEYAAADGLDTRRMGLLRRDILTRAGDLGLLAESGVTPAMAEDEALARLDAWLCDVKDLQIRDGLHIFARPPEADRLALLTDALERSSPGIDPAVLRTRLEASAGAERAALIAALDGRFVEPGPAGAPTRGRADVLPTGRNLFAVDPRAIPTRSAMVLAARAAEALVTRHLQEQGDWPRRWVIDLWGSTTMRTGGEDLALALILMGVTPVWDDGSNRVSGFEVLPIAQLERPRADVTLRISGLFRDAFEPQIALFDAAVRAVAARSEESAEWNPLAAAAAGLEGEALRLATSRIYGAAPGTYGAGLNALIERGAWQDRNELAAAWLAATAASYGEGLEGRVDAAGLAERVKAADAFIHAQDHAEIDLLEGGEYAGHEGGFAAAAALLGGRPALYHADTSNPQAPVARTVIEEVRRIVRGRAANPAWITGMMRHGYRGGAEIARALDALYGFAATLPDRLDPQFDQLWETTLGTPAVLRFLEHHNPEALAAMRARFAELMRRDLWRPRRNAIATALEEAL
jgi:cobaltochelatase CobN